MKNLLLVLLSVLICFSMFSCDIEQITELINEGVGTKEADSNGILVEWECDEIEFESDHKALDRDEYFRYSELSASEKSVYDAIYDAVTEGISVLNIENYKLSSDKLEYIYRVFVADNPALFYVSRNCQYVYEDGFVTELLIKYTDGETTDKFNNVCELSATADRKIIKNKAKELQDTVNEILSDIPEDASQFEKEKYIHDFLVETIDYNYDEAEKSGEGETLSHAFDVYGALCNGDAVCEGYAKAFQLLCNEVGINCAQVEGIGDSGEHMWNAVYIDDWYYVDVTWDDGIKDSSFPYYAYFNIPENVLEEDHIIDDSVLEVPVCNSDEYAYYNQYCAVVNDLNDAPINYKRLADLIAEGKLDHLVIYADGVSVTSEYIVEYFMNDSSLFKEYVKRMGYSINLKNEYSIIGDYYYIAI